MTVIAARNWMQHLARVPVQGAGDGDRAAAL